MAADTDLNLPRRTIRTETHRNCPLCGGAGTVLYQDIMDRHWSVPGIWGFRRRMDGACRYVSLDPRPIDADLPLLYQEYFTHGPSPHTSSVPPDSAATWKSLKLLLKMGYVALVTLTGLARARKALYEIYLGDRAPGRMFEIGCGAGERFTTFAAQGWTVQGQDVDAKTVAHARASTGLPIHLGPIDGLPESAARFDAVVMNHVIEHVPDPIELLRQASARLAPGGVLVAVTTNVESFGHHWFKRK